MLTSCLAKALAPTIQVNAVAPGWLETRWLAMYFPPEVAQAALESGGTKPADREDVAQAVLMLTRNDSITGQTLAVDRGELVS
jgi:NAD(P)-dependent dehydrogenase (short-subunit alcohol dehydrogenase family)